MKNNILFGLALCLLLAGCRYAGESPWSDELFESNAAEMRRLLQDCDASGAAYMAVEVATGRVVADGGLVRDSAGHYVPDGEKGSRHRFSEPVVVGNLFTPVVLTAALKAQYVDTAQRYSLSHGFIHDDHRPIRDGEWVDSLTIREAMATGSAAALADFGTHIRDCFGGGILDSLSALSITEDPGLQLLLPDSLPSDTAFYQLCAG